MWRKNLHYNDGDGQFTGNDGVDLNRNYDVDWGYDNEGSSTQFAADDYRGTGPASEPETRASQALIDRLKFKFLITYHSYGPLILYPFGWQVQTPSADDPLFVAYSGIDATPAISGAVKKSSIPSVAIFTRCVSDSPEATTPSAIPCARSQRNVGSASGSGATHCGNTSSQ